MTEAQLLIATDEYLKSGVHIGTKFKTKYMRHFIYKTRDDGLSVLNLKKIDQRIDIAAKFMSHYAPEDIILVSRRENGWKPITLFGQATGARVFPGRYPPGMMTNPVLETFTEAKLLVVVDSWPDRNAVNDALELGIPIIALCDTNNQANGLDLVIPSNNKGKKALGLVFWLLAREYMKHRGLIKADADFKYKIDDFTAQ